MCAPSTTRSRLNNTQLKNMKSHKTMRALQLQGVGQLVEVPRMLAVVKDDLLIEIA